MTNIVKRLWDRIRGIRYWVVWNDDGTRSVVASRTMPPRVGPYHAKRRGSDTPEAAQSLADGMNRVNRRFFQKQKAKRLAAQEVGDGQ